MGSACAGTLILYPSHMCKARLFIFTVHLFRLRPPGGHAAVHPLPGIVDDLQERLVGAGVVLGEGDVVHRGKSPLLLCVKGQGVHVVHLW